MQLASRLEQELIALRRQAQDVSMINPQLTLAERLSKELDQGVFSLQDIESVVQDFTRRVLTLRATDMRKMLNISSTENLQDARRAAVERYLKGTDGHQYHLVFTAHPIFSFSTEHSKALAESVVDQRCKLPDIQPLTSISLAEEHARAMSALDNARRAILELDRDLLRVAIPQQNPLSVKPLAMNMACWVGYDLDGRDDIRWVESFCFRLAEKARILRYYNARAKEISAHGLAKSIERELSATEADYERFSAFQSGIGSLAEAANSLTERTDKVVDIADWASELEESAKQASSEDRAIEFVLLAREMRRYRLGIGEIHLRLNALQVRNAMRVVDGREVSEARGGETSRQLIQRLNMRILALETQEVNFHDLDIERATAVRLMMLTRQILKHVDAVQPVRLLVAECERPLTLLSSLYLARQYQVAEKLDISPLFETRLGLERGAEVIEQLVQNTHYRQYVEKRGRLCIQTGFSDAGRFIGQLPATLAIERLQVKLAKVHERFLDRSVALLMFNTHGESLGRGGARGSVRNRQEYIFSPHARQLCAESRVPVIHESTFQGGDGYLWFNDPTLAEYTITRLFEAEFLREEHDDPLYKQSDFAIDLFLGIKNWHDALFHHPDYAELLGLFGHHMLPKTGSRPGKRASSSLGTRQDPSKIRAIVHNALLQQAGYLVNVVGGLGHASMIDLDRFKDLFFRSKRLQLLVEHAFQAHRLGSTASLLAYGRLFQRAFWINRAYQSRAPWHLRSCRSIADALLDDTRSDSIRRLTTVIRDDLLDLRTFERRLGQQEAEIYPDGRLLIDSLQVVRLVLIMEILFLISRVPRFAEHNDTGHADLIRMALRLDIETVIRIIENEFGLHTSEKRRETFSEQGAPADQKQRYQEISSRILVPIRRMFTLIKHISMTIGCLYGAHG